MNDPVSAIDDIAFLRHENVFALDQEYLLRPVFRPGIAIELQAARRRGRGRRWLRTDWRHRLRNRLRRGRRLRAEDISPVSFVRQIFARLQQIEAQRRIERMCQQRARRLAVLVLRRTRCRSRRRGVRGILPASPEKARTSRKTASTSSPPAMSVFFLFSVPSFTMPPLPSADTSPSSAAGERSPAAQPARCHRSGRTSCRAPAR